MIWDGDTPKGNQVRMHCRPDTSDQNICRLISVRDEYNLGASEFVGVAIDIGAHIGSVTVPLLIDNPDLHVVAIEPVPENLEVLRENVRLNEVGDRATVLPIAAGAEGMVPIEHGYRGWHRHVGNLGDGRAEHCENIMSMPFAAIRRTVGGTRIALLKIDCEGCEWEVLADPDIWRAQVIVGEFHTPTQEEGFRRVRELIGGSHRVSFDEWTFRGVALK